MLQRILVPLDGSTLAERALTYAVALAEQTAAELLLLRVVPAQTMSGDNPRARGRGADEAQRYVDDETVRLGANGTACRGVVRVGRPADCIIDSARTEHADLIAMATHGRTGPGRWVFGSVAEAVVAVSPVPVMAYRAWQPLSGDRIIADAPTLLVPLDGSRLAESIIDFAATLAEEFKGQLLLLTVQDDPTSIRDASDYLSDVQRKVGEAHADVPIVCDVRSGEVVHAIEQAVVDYDVSLVLMATHGRIGPRRTILGSIAGKVLKESDVPLVLLRPPSTEAEEDPTPPTTGPSGASLARPEQPGAADDSAAGV